MSNVVNLATYRNRREAEENKTLQTTVPCGTCGEMLWLTTHDDDREFGAERILVCSACGITLTLGHDDPK